MTLTVVEAAERLGKMTADELEVVEGRAVQFIDCGYCSSKKKQGCRVVLNGREGSRLPGYAHIDRRCALLIVDASLEDIYGPVSYKKSSSYIDDMLG